MLDTNANIAIVTIDGPDKNFLNPDVMAQVGADLLAADKDVSVSAILLTGAGDAFCGGLDLASIRAGGDPIEFARSLAVLLKIFPKLTKPVAAAVNGDAVASGASIVAACDYAVTVPSAKIGSYEVSVGVWPMVAQVPLIARMGTKVAMENIGSGEPFTAQRSLEVGLVSRIVEPAALIASASEWLILASRGGAANAGRVFFYELAEMSYEDGLDAALDKFAAQFKK
ncbi:enoyl-CoA hydratase/isomerase family protein [Aurantimicrobium minutum]|uniref:enoyl-CoA hydratase/isomerase family protein n=1 Tax=Aurantimicrobium minutum TaxID=708131 RepID=UPI002473E552|nr:enoyl-CoA hydratase/isomerase family protein [Aurantimicrobium minutum]MDH6207104.1 enoyl-CoA hydratase/carnithine racemase [Aurantimicrobium minutum]